MQIQPRTIQGKIKEASLISAANSYTASLKDYLSITNTINKDTLDVYPYDDNHDNLYRITFYDGDIAGFRKVIAKVIKIMPAFLQIEYIDGPDTEGLCPCGHKDILIKFIKSKTALVNIGDIAEIFEYIYPIDQYKDVVKVALLGISAEFIKSIVVRLRLFEDDCSCKIQEATVVDLKVGGHYQIDYMDHIDHTMYQIDGILKAISVEQNFGDTDPEQGFVRHECECNYHDQVGMGNICYNPFDDTIEKYNSFHFLNLPKACPEKILLTFDTSSETHSTFDKVWLTDIRGVVMIEDSNIEIVDPENPDENKPTVPEPDCCGNCCANTELAKGCLKHGTCCHFVNMPDPKFPPEYYDKEVNVGDWTYYIDRKVGYICGKNNKTEEIRHNIPIEEILEVYTYSGNKGNE